MQQPETNLSTDALPMAPRQPTIEVAMAPRENLAQPSDTENSISEPNTTDDAEEIPEPHPDWGFNIFLDKIAGDITSEDFEKMKHLFRGPGGIPETTLKEMKSPLDLFSIMRIRQYLSRDNLIYLQSMLFNLGRRDLVKQAAEYSNTIGNVLHFYPASALPENGFKYIKLHVEGRDFRNSTRAFVQSIRNRIASVICIPAEFVIIAGIEPSSSLLITLMIPELYVAILEDLLESGACNDDFKDLNIDIVEIKKPYHIGDAEDKETEESDQQKKLSTIYQQLEAKSKHLEDSEIERLRLTRELENTKTQLCKAEKQHFQDEVIIRTLKTINAGSTESYSPASLSSLSALKEFEEASKQSGSYDKKVLKRLLSANTVVVVNRMNEKNRIQQRQLALANEELCSQVIPLQLQLQQYRLFSEIDVNEMDKILLDSFRKLVQAFVEVSVDINEEALKILRKVSKSLRPKEREKLVSKYNWGPEDELKQRLDEDISFVLAGIFYKEVQDNQKVIDMEQFIKQSLEDVGRSDLMRKFQDLLRGLERNSAKPKRKRNSSQNQRSASAQKEKGETSSEIDDQHQLLNKVANQVQSIYDTIQAHRKTFGSVKDSGLSLDPPPYSRFWANSSID